MLFYFYEKFLHLKQISNCYKYLPLVYQTTLQLIREQFNCGNNMNQLNISPPLPSSWNEIMRHDYARRDITFS